MAVVVATHALNLVLVVGAELLMMTLSMSVLSICVMRLEISVVMVYLIQISCYVRK